MVIIRKKTWPKWFTAMETKRKNVELRLADFQIKKGDLFFLEEWNPRKKEYTGKLLKKMVKRVTKINLLDFYTAKDLKKYGCYLIEF